VDRGDQESGQTELVRFVLVQYPEIRLPLLGLAISFGAVRVGACIARIEGSDAIAPDIVVQGFTRIPFPVVVQIGERAPVAILIRVPVRFPGVAVKLSKFSSV